MKKYKLFVLLFIILMLALFNFGFGNDYYWHVKVGEYIVKNLKIPFHDIFSWYGTSNNLYWVSHEWLSEVVIYLFKHFFGFIGPLLFNFSIYGLLVFILIKSNYKKMNENKPFALIWCVVGLVIFSSIMLPRPHMISYVLLAITVYILYDSLNNEDSKKIYFIPIISLLWANFHGGSSNLPYILTLIFLLTHIISFKFEKIENKKISKKLIKKYIICILLSVIAIVINPHGLKMLPYPYINMKDSTMINSITEWAAPSINKGNYFELGLILLTIIIMIITKKKIKLIDFILLLAFIILGIKSLKFIPLLYIVSTFVIFNYIKQVDFEFNNLLYIMMFIMISIMLCISIPKLIKNYNKKPIPDSLISYIKEKEPKKLFNFYDYGGYLIYNDIKVFIDGRADMYSGNIFRDAIELERYSYPYLLNKYDFDMIVISNNVALNNHMLVNDKYELTKQSRDTYIYEKK